MFRYYAWRSFKRDDTCEIVYASCANQAREKYARKHRLQLREVEAEEA